MTPNEWADFWRYDVGVNVIPAVSATKKPKVEWRQWQTEPIPKELHDQWKTNNIFDDGMAIICGPAWHKEEGLWINGIDCDNRLGIDEFCKKTDGSQGTLDMIASDTLVEQHSNKEKCHIVFYTKEPIQSQAPLQGDDIPKIEIKSGGRFLLYCAGGLHKDGSPIEIIGKKMPAIVDKKRLEEKLDNIFKKYNISYLEPLGLAEFQKPVYDVDSKLCEGNNRGVHILSYLDSKKIKNPEMTEEDLFYLARKYERENCIGKYDDEKIRQLVRQAMGFGEQKIAERADINMENEKDAIIDNTAAMILQKNKFVTIRESDDTLIYDGKIYRRGTSDSIIKEETEKIIEHCKVHHTNEVINKIKRQTYVDEARFDDDPNVITLPNGILDLRTLELSPHTPNHLSRVLLPRNFVEPVHVINDDTIFDDIEKNIGDTVFWQFLVRSFTVDGTFARHKLESALEMLASVFVKKPIDDKAFMHLGGGENGKSVFLEYFEHLLGPDNVSSVTLHDIANDTFLRAELDGMSANIFSDLEQNELKKTGMIKDIISGDPVNVQRKHQQPFKLNAFCKMIFSCNRFPKVYDQSQGFFRRWIIIKWERNFENDPERDPKLKEKLRENHEELDRVFSCLLYLARLIIKRGIFSHSKNWRETQREWNENADPVDDFVKNYIIEGENHTSVREVYHFYKEIMIQKGENPLGIAQFGRAFGEYFEKDRITEGKREWVWLNISLKKPKQSGLGTFC